MNIYILEDDPNRVSWFQDNLDDFRHTDTASGFIAMLSDAHTMNETIDVLFLDHDLGGDVYVSSDEPNTGMEIVRFLENKKSVPKINKIVCHSLNSPARANMVERLTNLGYLTLNIPFILLTGKNHLQRVLEM